MKSSTVAIYIPSARCGKEAQREAYTFAELVEHRLGVRVVRLERQLAYDLHPECTEEQSAEFCLDALYRELSAALWADGKNNNFMEESQ